MSKQSQEKATSVIRGNVVVEVRFHPNGLVRMINQKPANMDPQDWFDFLCKQGASYRPLSGGRGTFSIEAEKFDDICALRQAAE